MMNKYTSELERNTLETQIKLKIDLSETAKISFHAATGIGFFDHMLNTMAHHMGAEISGSINGDTFVDCHHTIEDVGIVIGKILGQIAQNLAPVTRYGSFFIPMDESLARAVIDISGRPFLVFKYEPKNPMIGDYDTQMTEEFFRAVAFNMGATLHLEVLYGQNDHHMTEALFKAFAHAAAEALVPKNGAVLSAKGVL